MNVGPGKALFLCILVLALVFPVASQTEFNLFIESTFDHFVKSTSDTDDTGTVTGSERILSVQSQGEFNQGVLNGSSADRNDNSGVLGIGYLNGTNPSSTDLEEGLVGYWRMDRTVSGTGGTVKDYSGKNNDGRAREGVETGSGGVFSTNASKVDSSADRVQVSDSSSLDITGSLSMSLWFKANTLGNGGRILAKNGDTWWQPNYYFFTPSSGTVRFGVYTGSFDECDVSGLSTGKWYNAVLVFEAGNTLKGYINGTEKCSVSGVGNDPVTSSQVLTIGSAYNGSSRSEFQGSIDEARLYNRSLSSQEVSQLYFMGRDGSFNGNYTSKKIDTSSYQNWSKLEVDADVPVDTSLTTRFQALDSNGNVLETQLTSVNDGLQNYSVSVQNSEDARVSFNGSSSNVTKTWAIEGFKVYSKEVEQYTDKSIETQEDFNQGTFNGTSADRNDNSGTLGIGYLNGTNPSSTNLDDGLVAYWRFDRDISGDGGTVKDYSGNSREPVAKNNVVTGSNGVFSTDAFQYDNTNKQHLLLEDGNVSDVDFSSYSVNVWFRSEGGADDLATITSKSVGSTDKRTWILWFDDGSTYFTDGSLTWRAVGKDDSTQEIDIEDNSQDYRDGEWHMVTMVYKANDEGRLYVDGEFYDNQSVSQAATNASNIDIAVGGDPEDTDGRYFKGDIDEHRIYDRPLTESEVEQLYFHGMSGKFNGTYTQKVGNTQSKNWKNLEVNSSIPSDTTLTAKFKALDSGGAVKETQHISVNDGLQNYTLNVQDSEDAEVFFNGTSSNVTKSWGLDSFNVYSETSSNEKDMEKDSGRFQVPSSTGDLNVTGLGFEPDLVKFHVTATNENFDNEETHSGAEMGWGHGFAHCSSGSCEQVSQTIGTGSSSVNDHMAAASTSYSVFQGITSGGGDTFNGWINGSVTGFHGDGFNVNFDAVYQPEYVTYTAYSFPDSAEIDVGSFETPVSTGEKQVSTGFNPDYLELVATNTLDSQASEFPIGSKTETEGTNGWSHGRATSNEERVLSISANSYNINGHAAAGSTSEVLKLLFSDQNGVVQSRTNASLKSMDTNGFTLNFTEVSDSSDSYSKFDDYPVMYAAIKSDLDVEVGSFQTPTSTGEQNISVPQDPVGADFTGINTLPSMDMEMTSSSNSNDGLYGWSFGSLENTSEEQSIGYSAHSNSINGHASSTSNSEGLYILYSDQDGNVLGRDRGNITSIQSGNMTISWNDITTSSTTDVPYDTDTFIYTSWEKSAQETSFTGGWNKWN